MSKHFYTELTNRALIRVSGEEATHFLQGLLTCDIAHLKTGEATFGALLSPQGKILFDFFVIVSTNGLILDVEKSMAEDLIRRLIFYRLRAKVTIEPMDERTHVYAIWGEGLQRAVADGVIVPDPRLVQMGMRAYIRCQPEDTISKTMDDWHSHRISLGMPEGGLDYAFGSAFPHDCLMDQFKGVDFAKGCYVGQEVVSRMQHRGTARKRIVQISGSGALPAAGTEILSDGKSCGEITSVAGEKGLAMVRIDRINGDEEKRQGLAGSLPITMTIQPWCSFNWPAEDGASA
jgi:folate-binding protein YgfZ